MKKGILILLMLIFSGLVWADVYKTVDPSGNASFSDQASPNAEKVEVPPIQSYSAPAVTATAPAAPGTTAAVNTGYTRLEIVSPPLDPVPAGQTPSGDAGASIWDNNGAVTVNVAVEPSLHQGDTLQIFLDGQMADASQTVTSFNLTGILPGQHSVMAKIIDQGGNVAMSSAPLTLYLRMHTVNGPAGTR